MIYKSTKDVMKEKDEKNFQRHLMSIYIYINNVEQNFSNFLEFR